MKRLYKVIKVIVLEMFIEYHEGQLNRYSDKVEKHDRKLESLLMEHEQLEGLV